MIDRIAFWSLAGMPLPRVEQRIQCLPDAAACLLEAIGHVRGDVLVPQASEPHRHGRAVQRPLLVVEELLHEPGLGACEEIRGHIAVVLDVAPEQPVETAHLVDVLELVEGDEAPVAAVLLQA